MVVVIIIVVLISGLEHIEQCQSNSCRIGSLKKEESIYEIKFGRKHCNYQNMKKCLLPIEKCVHSLFDENMKYFGKWKYHSTMLIVLRWNLFNFRREVAGGSHSVRFWFSGDVVVKSCEWEIQQLTKPYMHSALDGKRKSKNRTSLSSRQNCKKRRNE